jgi:hypothetical protein
MRTIREDVVGVLELQDKFVEKIEFASRTNAGTSVFYSIETDGKTETGTGFFTSSSRPRVDIGEYCQRATIAWQCTPLGLLSSCVVYWRNPTRAEKEGRA